jgi:uncharacterized protein (TIGR02246 family)
MISLAAGQGTNQPQPAGAEQEVRKLERQWLDAYEKHDVAAMEKIVANEFTATFPDGRMQSKAQILKFIGQPRRAGSPSPKFSSEDVQARVFGDTVVLTGKLVTLWPGPNDTSMKQEARYTDTYVKRDGNWQVVASAMSNIDAGQKP